MTYSEKLRDPRWQKKRLFVFSRDNWACLACGSKDKNLQVHHAVYRKLDPWGYPDYLYQTLCDDCHETRQRDTDKAVDALRIALMSVPTERLTSVASRICAEAMEEIGLNHPIAAVRTGTLSKNKQKQGSWVVNDTSKTPIIANESNNSKPVEDSD